MTTPKRLSKDQLPLKGKDHPRELKTSINHQTSPGIHYVVCRLALDYKLTNSQIAQLIGIEAHTARKYLRLWDPAPTNELYQEILKNCPVVTAIKIIELLSSYKTDYEILIAKLALNEKQMTKHRLYQKSIQEVFRTPLAIKLSEKNIQEKTTKDTLEEAYSEIKEEFFEGMVRKPLPPCEIEGQPHTAQPTNKVSEPAIKA